MASVRGDVSRRDSEGWCLKAPRQFTQLREFARTHMTLAYDVGR